MTPTDNEIKDEVLSFLETVTYDEVMAYNFLLQLERNIAFAQTPDLTVEAMEAFDSFRAFASEQYGWDDPREQELGRLCNWHHANVPTRDWRMNYFFAVGSGFPESTLVEQFGDLKDQGDQLRKMLSSALKYKNRMYEVQAVLNLLSATYPLVHFEDVRNKIPLPEQFKEIVAWRDTSSRAISIILDTIDIHFKDSVVVFPTEDVREKLTKGICQSNVAIGSFYRSSNHQLIVGENGTIMLDVSKPVKPTGLKLVE